MALGPAPFDPAEPLDHHLVIGAVRTSMERKAQALRGGFARRQKQAIAAEIIEANPRSAKVRDHAR